RGRDPGPRLAHPVASGGRAGGGGDLVRGHSLGRAAQGRALRSGDHEARPLAAAAHHADARPLPARGGVPGASPGAGPGRAPARVGGRGGGHGLSEGGGVAGLVAAVERTRAELEEALADPGLAENRARFADVGKRYADLGPAFDLAARWRDAAERAAEAEELLAEDADEVTRALLREAREEMEHIGPELRQAMLEPDPNDDKDTIVEIRAAAGGEEAALFARDLLDVYRRYAESRGFQVELMGGSPGEAGGLKEGTLAGEGRGADSVLKRRGGWH